MRRRMTSVLVLIFGLSTLASAQYVDDVQLRDSVGTVRTWTLQQCLDYAEENNITVRQSRNTYLSGLEDTEQARAAIFPTVTGSVGQGVANTPFLDDGTAKTALTGSYGVSSSMTLYNGGKLRNAIKKQEVQNSIDSLSVEQNLIDVKTAIVQAYLQCLYAKEAISVNESTAEGSKAQADRAMEMWKAGSISKVDYKQLESQYFSDRYQVTVAKTTYDTYKLQLKQLLELGVNDELELVDEEASEEEVLRLIAPKETVYQNALEVMPEVASGELAVKAAEIAEQQAEAGFLPSLGLTAGISTSNSSASSESFGNQLKNYFGESIGLNLSIPIYSGRKNRTAVNKARIATENAKLDQISIEKSILNEVESTWLNAVSAQSQYVAAKEQESYAQESYDLTSEQFRLGMKNTVELITAKNELLAASQAKLQAKYNALLNINILDIYQGK